MKHSLLFVCLGNICRSPAAEGVFRHMVRTQNLHDAIHIDSAGTGGWHAGEPPDGRMIRHALKRGYDLSDLEARQFDPDSDFARFDRILTMDNANRRDVLAHDREGRFHHKVQPLTSYCRIHQIAEVPDPYHRDADGFEHVLDLIEDACAELLAKVRAEIGR